MVSMVLTVPALATTQGSFRELLMLHLVLLFWHSHKVFQDVMVRMVLPESTVLIVESVDTGQGSSKVPHTHLLVLQSLPFLRVSQDAMDPTELLESIA
jgi:hypothetical protein